jgi:hypothetical protein
MKINILFCLFAIAQGFKVYPFLKPVQYLKRLSCSDFESDDNDSNDIKVLKLKIKGDLQLEKLKIAAEKEKSDDAMKLEKLKIVAEKEKSDDAMKLEMFKIAEEKEKIAAEKEKFNDEMKLEKEKIVAEKEKFNDEMKLEKEKIVAGKEKSNDAMKLEQVKIAGAFFLVFIAILASLAIGIHVRDGLQGKVSELGKFIEEFVKMLQKCLLQASGGVFAIWLFFSSRIPARLFNRGRFIYRHLYKLFNRK